MLLGSDRFCIRKRQSSRGSLATEPRVKEDAGQAEGCTKGQSGPGQGSLNRHRAKLPHQAQAQAQVQAALLGRPEHRARSPQELRATVQTEAQTQVRGQE